MTTTRSGWIDSTVQTTHAWLHDIMLRMGWSDEEKAYHALRVVLHALRDRLGVNEVAHLAAQLPLLVRGVYYEGWHPSGKPLKEHRPEFLFHIEEAFRYDEVANSEKICHAVLGTIKKHITKGEVEKVLASLPPDVRTLWPQEVH